MKSIGLLPYSAVAEKIAGKTAHLLLGNGFSIACQPSFNYGSLFDYAKENGLTGRVLGLFDRLGTNNFEGVMRLLEDSHWTATHYGLASHDIAGAEEMLSDLEHVKSSLVGAIAHIHPEHTHEVESDMKVCCAEFLAPFHNVFSTNYDLLLYWVEMHSLALLKGRDGFRHDPDEPDSAYVVFSEHVGRDKGIFFLHGALHLYVSHGEVRKHTWSRTGNSLIKNIRDSLEKGHYPLFVAEGMAEKKLEQIQRSGYLSYCLGKLQRIESALVVYGLSLGESDGHIAEVIARNEKLETVYFGLYGSPDTPSNLGVRKNVEAVKARRDQLLKRGLAKKPLTVSYFDVTTAPVWKRIK